MSTHVKVCNMCNKTIPLFDSYIKIIMNHHNGSHMVRTFCSHCCMDPQSNIRLADILLHGMKTVMIHNPLGITVDQKNTIR